MSRFLDVDPRTLHLPTTRWAGADPGKFTRQLSRYGTSILGLPAIEVREDPEGRLVISDGVTRAVCVAKFHPGHLVTVEITGTVPRSVAAYPTVAQRLP